MDFLAAWEQTPDGRVTHEQVSVRLTPGLVREAFHKILTWLEKVGRRVV